MYDVQFEGFIDGVIYIGMLEHVHLLRLDAFLNVSSFVLDDGEVLALHYITRNALCKDAAEMEREFQSELESDRRCKACTVCIR